MAVSVNKLFVSLLICTVFVRSATALFCGDDNCYQILGVPRNSTKAEIRRAYRRISSEKHPDKRPGDEAAVDEFRRIGTAYETLTDDSKRAKYDDFLDNPTKYWQYLMENAKDNYAPKSNVFLVLAGILGVANLLHWLNMNHTYKQTITRMRESQEYKREVSRLLKSKQAATAEEADGMINLHVEGLQEPDWRNLMFFKLIQMPGHVASYCSWHLRWFLRYRIRKTDYTDEDKLYLIQKHMELSNEEWDTLNEKERASYLSAELWDKEKYDDFMRLKRIEMNRMGKSKKKKKRHTPVPYSEMEEVQME